MRLTKLIGSVGFGAALVAVSATAGAQTRGGKRDQLPLNFIDRPLTLPAGVLQPEVEFNTVHTASPNAEGSFSTYNLNVGAAVGLSRNFEIQSTFLPMQLGPNQQYGDPNIQGTLRVSRTRNSEVGLRFNVTMHTLPLVTLTPTGKNANGQPTYVKQSGIKVDSTTLSPGVPILFRSRHSVRVDTGLFADITLGREVTSADANGTAKTDGAIWGMRLPVDVAVAVSKNAYIGAGTGFKIDDLNQAGSSFSIPLKLQGSWSWGTRRHPFLDINPYVSWDHLLTPGQKTATAQTGTNGAGTVAGDSTLDSSVHPTTATTAGPQSAVHWDAWQMGVNFRGYFHFM